MGLVRLLGMSAACYMAALRGWIEAMRREYRDERDAVEFGLIDLGGEG